MEFRNRLLARMPPSGTPGTRGNFSRETTIRLLVNYGLQVLHVAYYTIFPSFVLRSLGVGGSL